MIKVLDPETVRQIAAGEVIERPSSALRELLDNALDSGADEIHVVLEEGGKKFLSITDNGCGMNEDDLQKAPILYATSKILNIDDLNNLHTYGFRGEALASLAGVSLLKIASCQENADHGLEYVIDFGTEHPLCPKAMNKGTVVIVENLFANLPARLKFLGSAAAEQRACTTEFIKKALTYPQCAFRMSGKNGDIYNLPAVEDLSERIHAIFPDAPLQAFSWQENGISATGFCSPPDWYRPTRSHQFLFVNRRPIEWAQLRGQIIAAYGNLLPPGRFPACFIYLTIAPDTVDFNVHPQKREIRFQEEGLVASVVRRALRQGLMIQTDTQEPPQAEPYHPDFRTAPPSYSSKNTSFPKRYPSQNEIVLPKSYRIEEHPSIFMRVESQNSSSISEKLLKSRFVGLILQTYLVYDEGNEVFFIDFHAMHERVRYEKIKGHYASGLESQALMIPLIFEITRQDADIIESIQKKLEYLGFSLNRVGETTVAIDSLPALLEPAHAEIVLMDLLQLANGEPDFTDAMLWDSAIKSIACKGSVKRGDMVSKTEMDALIQHWVEVGALPSCPHGRPIIIQKSRADFDKEFKRLGF
ncbi:MAG: DNA mismatch repair endonuclease MutL [Brevinema sp.]